MYKNILRVNGDYLAKAQALPVNTSAPGNGGPIRAHNTQGALELAIVAATQVGFSSGKSLTVTVQDCDTQNGSYADVPVLFKKTFAGATTIKAGEVIGVLPLASDVRPFVKVKLTTDDTAPTGTVDVFTTYLPR